MLDNNIIFLQNENKEIKESNFKLADQIQDLERTLKIQSMKLDYKTMKDLDNHLTETDSKLKAANEKSESLENELKENNFRLEYLESMFVNKVKEAETSNILNSEFYIFFRDHVIKSIEQRDEEKSKNKIILEKILILCKKLKKLQK